MIQNFLEKSSEQSLNLNLIGSDFGLNHFGTRFSRFFDTATFSMKRHGSVDPPTSRSISLDDSSGLDLVCFVDHPQERLFAAVRGTDLSMSWTTHEERDEKGTAVRLFSWSWPSEAPESRELTDMDDNFAGVDGRD